MTFVIGLDFDNTIVSYDALIHRIALERRLIPPDLDPNKRTVRDHIRQGPRGDIDWQELQALVYGPLMPQATLIDGVRDFADECRRRQAPLFIVSHKTEFAGLDRTGTNLRDAALRWMETQRFFETDGLGLSRARVFFESTRDAKIARVASIGCTHFVDDLEEVFLEPAFPGAVRKILFAPDASARTVVDADVAHNWRQITDYVFRDDD